ncbi:homoserine kinase, partial [Erysiphe pulchra]
VPCSSANIGPGFDVIGLALSIWLELRVEIIPTNCFEALYNCFITYEGQGAAEVPLIADQNLITQTALYVLRCHGQRAFPVGTRVHIKNPIPLGRGLGSSGAAVVAGVALGNEVGKLGLTKARMLDYCLMIERHPDNVAAALYGGFVGTYLNDLSPADISRVEIPVSEVLSPPVGGVDTGIPPPVPAFNIGHYMKFSWAPELKAVTIIPDFEVATAEARRVLPSLYSRADVVFNMQRIALLPVALGQSPPDAEKIYLAIQDRIHQPYRMELIPGLAQILQEITPKSFPGLCGICLSGAGPTILALATENFEAIANAIMDIFQSNSITCGWRLLELADEGTTV